MTKEAIKQALEALTNCTDYDNQGDPLEKKDVVNDLAIEALIESLKQDQGEQLARLGWQEIDCPICGGGARAFPKQEQGEPVAYGFPNSAITGNQKWMSLREQIPENDEYKGALWIPLYDKPQTKEWVGLTADKLNAISDSMRTWNSFQITDVYFAIEAKLKENNGY